MATPRIPRSRISASIPWSSSASGVVWCAGRRSSPSTYWIVPITPVASPRARSNASTRYDVVVLPFVPVMPTSVRARDGWPYQADARRASDARAAGTSTCATDRPATGSPSVTTSVAPRRTASGMKRRASCLNPGTATKQPPGSTRRESAARDETDRGGSPTMRLSVSAARSSLTGISLTACRRARG